jgi:hypothetical protein
MLREEIFMSHARLFVAAMIAATAMASANTSPAAPIFAIDPGPLHATVTTLHADLGGYVLELFNEFPGHPSPGSLISFDFTFADLKTLTLPPETGEFERVDFIVTADDGPISLTQGPTSFYFADAAGAPVYSGLIGAWNLEPPGNSFGWASRVPPWPTAITFSGLHLGGTKGYFPNGQPSAHLLSAEITFYTPATVGRVPEPQTSLMPIAVLAVISVKRRQICRSDIQAPFFS